MTHKSDRAEKNGLRTAILARKGLLGCGPEYSAALHSRDRAVYAGADRFGQGEVALWEGVSYLACAPHRIVAVMKDGTLRFTGSASVFTDHRELFGVRTVSCSATHTAALLGNGRVVADPSFHGYEEIGEWPPVCDVVCGKDFTLGLTYGNQPLLAGGKRLHRHILSGWEQIEGIFTDCDGEDIFAITSEGALRSTRRLPRRVRAWRNLVFIAADRRHIWGVTEDGRLLSTDPAVGSLPVGESYAVCAVSGTHAAALTWDGLILSVGENGFGQCDTRSFGTVRAHHDRFNENRLREEQRVAEREKHYQRRVTEASLYADCLVCGSRLTACLTAEGRVLATGSLARAKRWSAVRALACGNAHLAALHEDGTVSMEGNVPEGCTDVERWRGVKSIAAGKYYTLGLTEEGTVLFCGKGEAIARGVAGWTGIRRIYTADSYAVGVDLAGSLRVAGEPPFDASILDGRWDHPTELSLCETHMAAVYPDGRVTSTVMIPASPRSGDGEVTNTCNWSYVRSIAVGRNYTLGLTFGGRVESVHTAGRVDTSSWRDVVAVACGSYFALGLTADGHVLTAPVESESSVAPCPLPDTSLWTDVLTIACGERHAVALTRDGSVLAGGDDSDRQCSGTAHFVLFKDIRQLYGYGRYSRRLERMIRAHREQEKSSVPEEEPGILPFRVYAPAMRENVQELLSRLTGSDTHLTAVDAAGRTVTYRYETARTLTETLAEQSPLRTVASVNRTVLIYPDGKARERRVDTPDAPPTNY